MLLVLTPDDSWPAAVAEMGDPRVAWASFAALDQAIEVMLLSPPDDPQTLTLEQEIENDLTADSGRTTAFTQNQRYVSEEKLRKARTTSELV